jgi:hypothetical protein
VGKAAVRNSILIFFIFPSRGKLPMRNRTGLWTKHSSIYYSRDLRRAMAWRVVFNASFRTPS